MAQGAKCKSKTARINSPFRVFRWGRRRPKWREYAGDLQWNRLIETQTRASASTAKKKSLIHRVRRGSLKK